MKINIRNNSADWEKNYEKLLSSNQEEINIIINMTNGNNTESDLNLFNITKVFPLIDILLEKENHIVVNIQKCEDNIRKRILPLIFTQIVRFKSDSNIIFNYDGCPIECVTMPKNGDTWTPFFSEKNAENKYKTATSRILKKAKVIQMSSTDNKNRRFILVDELLDKDMQENLIKEIKRVNEKYSYEITFKYKQETISNIFPFISISSYFLNGKYATNNDISMDVIGLNTVTDINNDIMNSQFSHMLNLERYFEEYIKKADIFEGTKNNIIAKAEKESLSNELTNHYNNKKASMSLLGRMMWILVLRNLIESKELQKYSLDLDGNGKWTLDAEAIEKSAFICATYAEGLYQIIENSCLYSHGKRAYFGMRIHRVSPAANTAKNLYRANIKKQLYDRFKNCYRHNPNHNVSGENIFTKGYMHILEFYVMDDASSGEGIIYKSHMTVEEQEFNELNELIEYRPKYNKESLNSVNEYADQVAHHYGMRVFFKNIERNDGCVILETPTSPDNKAKMLLYYSSNYKFNTSLSNNSSNLTAYNILVPLFPQDNDTVDISSNPKPEKSDLLSLGKNYCISRVNYNKTENTNASQKIIRVDKIKEELKKNIITNETDQLIAINALNCTVYNSELLAKAIFKLSAECCYTQKLKIAILFSEKSNCPQEFIRIFSSFYDKINLNDKSTKSFVKTVLENIQIAICTKDSDKINVNFILSCDSPNSAYTSARNFLYVNFETCVKYIPLLKYFSNFPDIKSNKSESSHIFPFDIYLSNDCFISGDPISSSPKNDCLFLDRMQHMLHSDLQSHTDGCRIPNIHIRLGSKIHLDCFYEAELLFRNVGNIQRFSYIITRHILLKLSEQKTDKKIMLVGYEKYSAELILQIKKLLETADLCCGAYLIPAIGEEKKQCIELSPLFDNSNYAKSLSSNESKSEILLVTVIPVGSTMSTVYKVKHTFEYEYLKKFPKAKITDFLNYCIVAINSQLTNEKDDNDITWNYWQDINRNEKEIIVLHDSKKTPEIVVNYLLAGEAKWLRPMMLPDKNGNCCEMCNDLSHFPTNNPLSPLIQVDKTNMMTTNIFKLKDSGANILFANNITQNHERMTSLKGYIDYGHICREDNHYQFYIDHKRFYQENSSKVDDWLSKIKIEQSAFNIVISPNDIDNTAFVSSALKNVFKNSLRYLHIDINNAYREDIRLKFSKIADEYKYLRLNMPNIKFNIYYISNTIVSSRTIARAKLLVSTLLDESGIAWPYPYIFEKVILLICRSSFSTMKQYVRFPKTQVESYITLNIPQYNTIGDKCPSCKLQEEYSLLRKRCTSPLLSKRFERLEKKSQKRTLTEFVNWQHENILLNHSYYNRLKSWIYFHPEQKVIDEEIFADLMWAFNEEFKEISTISTQESDEDGQLKKLCDNKECQESFKEKISEKTLSDIIKRLNKDKNSDEHNIVDAVKKTVISEQNYRRLYCLQRAYEELIPLNEDGYENVEEMNNALYFKTRKTILEIIDEKLIKRPNNRYDFAENAEWLISYIKVLSREHLSKYYHIRKAIVNIMYDMLEIMSAKNENLIRKSDDLRKECNYWNSVIDTMRYFDIDNKNKKNIDNSLCASLQYEVFMTLVHRLSVLQCCIVYQKEAIQNTLVRFTDLNNKYFNSSSDNVEACNFLKYIELPPMKEIISRYIKSIKTATMLTANDDPCYQLLEEN